MMELCARYGDQPQDRLQVADALRRGRSPWAARSESGAASLPAPDRARRRGDDLRGAPAASELGPGQALGTGSSRGTRRIEWPAISTAGDLLARRGLVKKRRRRRPHQHPGVVPRSPRPPNDLWTADFKGHFRTRRSDLLLSAHGRRSAHALPARVPRFAVHQGRRRAPHLRAALSRVRLAARDSHRQRRALRDHRHSRALAAQRLVDAAGHSAPAHPAGPPAAERRPRAHAQDAEGRGDAARRAPPSRPSSAPSTRSAASTTTNGHTSRCAIGHPAVAVPSVAAALHRRAAAARVSGSLPRQARDQRRHHSASRSGCCSSPTR